MLVVADSTPLNYLIIIGHAGVLHPLFDQVHVPVAVISELNSSKAPEVVREWVSNPPAWLIVKEVPARHFERPLDPGESEAITLAAELGAPILIDERDGREVASHLGLHVIGTLGVLALAHRKGLLEFSESVGLLRHTTIHLSDFLLSEASREVYGSEG